MYKLFSGAFFFVALFFIFLVFPKDSFAQTCGGGSYYCGGYYETCRLPDGEECTPLDPYPCTCTLSCTGNPGPANSCSGATSSGAAICNDLRNYACFETPCGPHSGVCSWNAGGGGGGCTNDNQCPGCLGCNVNTGACTVQVNAYCSSTCSGGACLSNGNCSCPNTPTPLPACPQNPGSGNTIQCQGSCVTDWSPLGGYSCSGGGQCCQKNPPSACPGLPAGGVNTCRSVTCNPEETIYGSATNNACGTNQLCCYSATTACPGLPGDGSTNACVTAASCPGGTTPYGSLTNNACGSGRVCCNTPPGGTATACPANPPGGGVNSCVSGASCPGGSTAYGSTTNNACGSGQVCCNTPPSACPLNPPGGGTNSCVSGSVCPGGTTNYGNPSNNACGAGSVCCNTPAGATCASIGGACMASGLVGTQSGCPAGYVRVSQGAMNCTGVTPVCYTCAPAPTQPQAVTVTPRPPTPTVTTGCGAGYVTVDNVDCNVRGVGCCPASQPFCSSATNYLCSSVEDPNVSEIGVFTDTNGSGVYDVGDSNGPNVRFLMSNTPNQQPWIGGLWSFSSSSYSYFSVQTSTIPSGYQEVSRTGSTTVSPGSRFVLLLRQIPPTVTLQGRFVGANGTTQVNLVGQGVSITGLGSKTSTPWNYTSIPTGTRTLVINQISGYATKYRCRSESSSTCAGIPTTFTSGTQVTAALPTPGSYIDIYVQYVVAPSCSVLTRNARQGDIGSAPATGSIGAGSSLQLFATIVNDDNNRSNSVWSSTCGTFPSTNWDYATFQAPNTAGTCIISYSLYGVNQPSCSATMTVASACSGATSTQVISGTIFSDAGNNDCASGAVPYTGTAPSLTLRSSPSAVIKAGPVVYNSSPPPPYRLTDTTSCSTETKTVSMTNLPPDYVVRGYKTTPSTWIAQSGYDVTLATSANTTLDWCVSNNSSWYQTVSGDVRYPNIANKVPASSVGSQSLATSPNTPGVFFSSQGTISTTTFGQGAVSASGWKVSDEYQYNDDFRNGLGGMSYTFFASQVRRRNMPTSVIPGSTFTFTSATTEQIYTKTGNLTITASGLTTPGKSIVILVDGDVTISGPVTAQTGQGNLIVIAASGNITVVPTIGSAAALSTPALDGYFTAERNIIIQSSANCATSTSDLRLNVSGALIANSLRPFATGGSGKIQNGRTLCANNANFPALSVSARPEFLIQLTDFYKSTYKVYKEVNP